MPFPASGPNRAWVRLNLGCGPIQPSGWINVDGSNRALLASRFSWLDRLLVALRVASPTEFNASTTYANLRRRFPVEAGSVDAIYMGEILEHFTQDEGERVVGECYRVLKPGGLLRIRVPDNARFWQNYLLDYQSIRQQPREGWSLAHTRWIKMYFDELCVRRPRPWQSMTHYHKWMYDEISLTLLVERVGFRNVERMGFRQSAIPGIDEVEARDDLIIEAIRP